MLHIDCLSVAVVGSGCPLAVADCRLVAAGCPLPEVGCTLAEGAEAAADCHWVEQVA